MSQQESTREMWRRIMKKLLHQERMKSIRKEQEITGAEYVATGRHTGNPAQTLGLSKVESGTVLAFEASRTPGKDPKTSCPITSHPPSAVDAGHPCKACHTPIVKSTSSPGSSDAVRAPQHDSDTPSPKEHDEWIETEDTCSLIYLHAKLLELRRLNAKLASERESA